MAKQETLTLFPEIEEVTRKMSDSQFGSLIRAVMAYRFRGEAYNGDDIAVDIAFRFVSSQVDRAETAKAARAKAAKDRWDMQSDASGMQTDANECKAMQTDAKVMQSDAEGMQTNAPIHSIPIHSIPILNTRESSADEPPTPRASTKQTKKSFGEFGWVKLTDDEFNRLINDLGEAEVNRCIAYIDESAQATGNKNKWRDWNLVIRRCSRDKWGASGTSGQKKTSATNNGFRQGGKPDAMTLRAIQRRMAEPLATTNREEDDDE